MVDDNVEAESAGDGVRDGHGVVSVGDTFPDCAGVSTPGWLSLGLSITGDGEREDVEPPGDNVTLVMLSPNWFKSAAELSVVIGLLRA